MNKMLQVFGMGVISGSLCFSTNLIAAPNDIVATVAGEKITEYELGKEGGDDLYNAEMELYSEKTELIKRIIRRKLEEIQDVNERRSGNESPVGNNIEGTFSEEQILAIVRLIDSGNVDIDELTKNLDNSLSEINMEKYYDELEKKYDAKILIKKPSKGDYKYEFDDHGFMTMGNPDAPVKIVYFFDYSCLYCSDADAVLKEVFDTYGDKVKIVLQHAYDFVPESERLADAAAICAAEYQVFWGMMDKLYAMYDTYSIQGIGDVSKGLGVSGDDWRKCMTAKVEQRRDAEYPVDFQDVIKLDGTPSFWVNGYMRHGLQTIEAMSALVDKALASRS